MADTKERTVKDVRAFLARFSASSTVKTLSDGTIYVCDGKPLAAILVDGSVVEAPKGVAR